MSISHYTTMDYSVRTMVMSIKPGLDILLRTGSCIEVVNAEIAALLALYPLPKKVEEAADSTTEVK